MKWISLEQIKELKTKFWSYSPTEREAVSVSFLKVKLSVQNPQDEKIISDFLGAIKPEMSPDVVDQLMGFFHSEEKTLPGFVAEPTESNDTNQINHTPLPEYKNDDDTLKEGVAPFRT